MDKEFAELELGEYRMTTWHKIRTKILKTGTESNRIKELVEMELEDERMTT